MSTSGQPNKQTKIIHNYLFRDTRVDYVIKRLPQRTRYTISKREFKKENFKLFSTFKNRSSKIVLQENVTQFQQTIANLENFQHQDLNQQTPETGDTYFFQFRSSNNIINQK